MPEQKEIRISIQKEYNAETKLHSEFLQSDTLRSNKLQYITSCFHFEAYI